MKNCFFFAFVFLLRITLSQPICLDTNCADFKGALIYKDTKIPKNYTGFAINRYEQPERNITINLGTKKKKHQNGDVSDYIKKLYKEEEKNQYKNGQIVDIKQFVDGNIKLIYNFHDNGKLNTLVATRNSENKATFVGNFIIFPIVSYYKSGTIKSVFYATSKGSVYTKILYYPSQKIMFKTYLNENEETQGVITSYYENGRIEKIGMTDRNLMHGYLLSYSEKGELLSTQFFRNNVLVPNENLANFKAQLYNLKSIVEEENANVDRQERLFESIKELQSSEDLKRKKEIELKAQEELIKRKQLELELLSKNKAVSDLTLKAKEAEILRNVIEANLKKKEIEDLNHKRTLNELVIKKKEYELFKSKIEAEKKFIKNKKEAEKKEKLISGLEKEKQLSKQLIQQQKYIQNLILIGLLILLIFSFFLLKSFRKTKKANKIIHDQKEITESQKQVIEEKQREIVDSINYAKRLQNAVLPPMSEINSFLPNSFVYYKPKDIVAGDFFWTDERGDYFFIAAADCTGHGVPGAMVSLVCSNALYRSVNEFNIMDTGEILNNTRDLLLDTFKRSGEEIRDGMDISLCRIDKNKKEIQWSGANNPLWYFKNEQFFEIKGDKQAIGKTDNPQQFTSHLIQYNQNSNFYLFTDGYQDQFSEQNKKMTKKRFRELICAVNHKKMFKQRVEIKNFFLEWKKDSEQIDDVCVIGFSPFDEL